MWQSISKSVQLLFLAVIICCGIYPLALWAIGQAFFPFQANGSLLLGPDGKPVGSLLIAQPFTRDENFQPRPSAASYDASASASSSLAASNYLLRDRVARTLGPMVKYGSGPRAGQLVGPDVESWFQRDEFQGTPQIVAQWAKLHNTLARAWVKTDPTHAAYVEDWAKTHPTLIAQWIKDNRGTPTPHPRVEDLAVIFFDDFSRENPGRFPSTVTRTRSDGKPEIRIEPIKEGSDIQSVFFDMWRQDHPDADLQDIPGDLLTTSGSGLDPHITLKNAEYQLDRVAAKWAAASRRDLCAVREEIERTLQQNSVAPLGGLAGEKLVNVLEVNLELRKRYGAP
jgi:potassium-transporting ATPase KdpC subunit